MPEAPPELQVSIGPQLVGRLALTSGGAHSIDEMEFAFEESYLSTKGRPVLGQRFEDDPTRRHTSRMRAPWFFSNLLPEGRLRDLIAKRAGVSPEREFFLLSYLGGDLPGAVILKADETLPVPPQSAEAAERDAASALKFSLAGVQLKFSMVSEGKGLTLPVSGEGGDWLVKMPDARAALVPENELSMMQWAKAAGMDVPEIRLVPVSEIRGLPPEAAGIQGNAFAIRRFDRPQPGTRTHIEDFAQVLGVYAHEKYEKANHETVGKILLALGGMEDLLEYVARVVFVVAIGNSDAHLKNWSLIYPDGIHARLAPAYDMVSTIQYPELSDDLLGLNLARSKRFEDVSEESFRQLAARIGADPEAVAKKVRSTVEAIRSSWSSLRPDLPVPEQFKARIEQHWRRVPLFSGPKP